MSGREDLSNMARELSVSHLKKERKKKIKKKSILSLTKGNKHHCIASVSVLNTAKLNELKRTILVKFLDKRRENVTMAY